MKHEIINELFELLLSRYQTGLEESKGSEFVFDYVDKLHYKFNKISLKFWWMVHGIF